ncbi:MAG: CfrBI family restriction endonuclease [Gammaproteobacteria bacterium]|nr:CfrBI family restriction endonuclease [Gammaproteobacteria bacterium]
MNAPSWKDPFSAEGLRDASARILTGTNYRLFFDGVTRQDLLKAYTELHGISQSYPNDDEKWRGSVRELIQQSGGGKDNIRYWLIGLGKKTAQNLGLKVSDYPAVFDMMLEEIENYPSHIKTRDIALLMWCGAATLTIRGSLKSKIGKALELSLARSALAVLGLEESDHFQVNIRADDEVARQMDCEMRTPRGMIRMEIGLIGTGNTEVVGDKVERMGKNDIVLVDTLPPKSSMWKTAESSQVKIIQMRNNNPVEELRRHLMALKVEGVHRSELKLEDVAIKVEMLPLSVFKGE